MPLALRKICLQIQGMSGKASAQHSFSSLIVSVLCVLGYICKGQALPHTPQGALAGTQSSSCSGEGWEIMEFALKGTTDFLL